MEVMSVRIESTVTSTSDEETSAASCSNPNRLFEGGCEVTTERALTKTTESSMEISNSASNQYSESNTNAQSSAVSYGTSSGTSSSSSFAATIGYSMSSTVGASLKVGADALFAKSEVTASVMLT